MAKQTGKFGIGSTLKKKIELKTTAPKDIADIQEKVAKIHSEELEKPIRAKAKTTQKRKSAAKSSKTAEVAEKEEMKRLTIDIPKSLHRKLKSKTAEEDISIKDLLNGLIAKYVGK